MRSPIQIARAYDALGVNVLPVRPGDKSPMVPWKAYQDERTTRYLESWFAGYGSDQVGFWVLCGRISGLVVVDCDDVESARWVRDLLGDRVESTWIAKTAKGYHLWFAYPAEGMRSWSIHDDRLSLDVRAEGGGVMVPPSLHPKGGRYKWLDGHRPSHGETLGDLPQALRYPEAARGSGGQGKPRGGSLRDLLANPPQQGDRNVWLTQVAGHLARKYRDDPETYHERLFKINERKLDPPLSRREASKTAESIWEAETSKPASTNKLVGDGQRLWLERTDGARQEWADFDMQAIAVGTTDDRSATFWHVRVASPHWSQPFETVLDSATLAVPQRLAVWLAGKKLSIISGQQASSALLQRYLVEQNAPATDVLSCAGWHKNIGFVEPNGNVLLGSDGRPIQGKKLMIVNISPTWAEFRYGHVSESEARAVLREVLTYQDSTVASVFGAWWAAVWLKEIFTERAALFPFMALKASSGSGKTTGIFRLLAQLNGQTAAPGHNTGASLRDRLSAHLNGQVWVDDKTSMDEDLDLIRLTTAKEGKQKISQDFRHIETRRLVAPVVLSGESLGKVTQSKAYMDRAIVLDVPSPVHRRSEANPLLRAQFDDLMELWNRYDQDLTKLAGTMAELAFEHMHLVHELWEQATRGGAGRNADKWAILLIGAAVLSRMTQDPLHFKRVKTWVEDHTLTAQQSAENDLTRVVVPQLWRRLGYPDSPYRDFGHPNAVWHDEIHRCGRVHMESLAAEWREYAVRVRDFDPRVHESASLRDQLRALGVRGKGKLFQIGTRSQRVRFHELPARVWREVRQRAGQ